MESQPARCAPGTSPQLNPIPRLYDPDYTLGNGSDSRWRIPESTIKPHSRLRNSTGS